MSNKKDIFDLFRANEPKLKQRPSPQAWDRLEAKLDRRRASGGATLYRRLAMAAALLVLIAFVAILPSYLGPKTGDQMAFNESAAGSPLEEITPDGYSSGNARPLSIEEVYREIDLKEGDRAKRLTVAIRNSGPINQPPAWEPSDNRTELAEGPTEIRSETGGDHSTPALDVIIPSPAMEPGIAVEVPPSEPVQDPEVEEVETYAYDDAVTEYEEDAGFEAESGLAKEKEARKAMPAQAPAAEEAIINMDVASNVITYEGENLDPGVQQFQWLIGQWKSDEGIGNSFERWEIADAFTIKGQGILVLNGKETFTEEMQIQMIGQQLYFITTIDEAGQKRYFRLKSYDGDIAIFEDEENAAFPQQVIIEQNGPNTFNATFTEEDHEDMTPNQQNYLQYRNAVQPDRATRNLSRIGQ